MKKIITVGLIIAMTFTMITGCGAKEENESVSEIQKIEIEAEDIPSDEILPDVSEEPEEVEENHDGQYRNELSGEWIDESLRDQRPIAVMVDNELTALPHYGVNDADIVYEVMNSLENNRVTRLMVVMKDWQSITQLGSVRSARPTNFMLAAEYNAILIHDGGPFYINDYIAKGYTNNISGGFGRFSNGKPVEFTEYVTYEDYNNPEKGKNYPGLKTQLENYKYSTTYNSYYPGEHFTFSEEEFTLDDAAEQKIADKVILPFPHNSSVLTYNSETRKYEYSEYGDPHVDAGKGNEVTSFKNVILQSCDFTRLDEQGYLVYHVVGSGSDGYYLTNGKAIPITWSKSGEAEITEFNVKATGEPIKLNVGKTYIGLVPADKWRELGIQ